MKKKIETIEFEILEFKEMMSVSLFELEAPCFSSAQYKRDDKNGETDKKKRKMPCI